MSMRSITGAPDKSGLRGARRLPLQSGQGITARFPVQATGVWRRPRARPQKRYRWPDSSVVAVMRPRTAWMPHSRCIGRRPAAWSGPATHFQRRIAERGSEEDRQEGRQGRQARSEEWRFKEGCAEEGRTEEGRTEEGSAEEGSAEEGSAQEDRRGSAGQGRREEGAGEGGSEEDREACDKEGGGEQDV